MSLLSRLSTNNPEADNKCSKDLVILNALGMHARPSARFVKVSNRYKSDI